MEQMEEKLGAILSNPQLMQQIMSMAQSLGQNQQSQQSPPPQSSPNLPNIDLGMIQKLSGMLTDSGITQEENNLLCALKPYLNREKVLKLEKAMQAAKMARLASSFLNAGGLQLPAGR